MCIQREGGTTGRYAIENKQHLEDTLTSVAESDELVGILCHIPDKMQEVNWVLGNLLTKG